MTPADMKRFQPVSVAAFPDAVTQHEDVELVRGVSALVERFDAFILDQCGVLLDGTSPYPGAAR